MNTEQAIQRVQAWWRASGLSKRAVAKAAGLSITGAHHIDRDDWRPNTTTLIKLERLVPPHFDPDAKGRRKGGAR